MGGDLGGQLMTAAANAGIGIGLFFVLVALVCSIPLIVYFFNGFVFRCIGNKAGLDNSWMPFVPIARQLYEMRIANCPWWFIFLYSGTFISVVPITVLCSIINAVSNNKLGILSTILWVFWYIADLVVTYVYRVNYYKAFGWNGYTAVLHIIPAIFGPVTMTFKYLFAFSDSVQYNGIGEVGVSEEDIQNALRKMGIGGNGGIGGNVGGNVGGNPNPITPPSGPSSIITGVAGAYSGATFNIGNGETITFGRSSTGANIVFDQYETDISRKHCTVTYDAARNQFILVDYSSNGTYLADGSRLDVARANHPEMVSTPQYLQVGTVIALGSSKKNMFRLG